MLLRNPMEARGRAVQQYEGVQFNIIISVTRDSGIVVSGWKRYI